MNILMGLGAFLFCQLFLHELGHYLVAKRIGAKNIGLVLTKWHRIPSGIAVKMEYGFDWENKKEIVEWHLNANAFHLGGCLVESIGLLFFNLIGIFSVFFTSMMLGLMVIYGFMEATNPRWVMVTEE